MNFESPRGDVRSMRRFGFVLFFDVLFSSTRRKEAKRREKNRRRMDQRSENINRPLVWDVYCSSLHRSRLKRERKMNDDEQIAWREWEEHLQVDDEENGRLLFTVILVDKIFAIECLINEADGFGLRSIETLTLRSSSSSCSSSSSSSTSSRSSSSLSSSDGSVSAGEPVGFDDGATNVVGCWKKNGLAWWNERYALAAKWWGLAGRDW